jgi:surface antigen
MIAKFCLRGALLAAVLVLVSPAMATTSAWWFKEKPFAHFTPDDHKLFEGALNDALKQDEDGKERVWSNKISGARGTLKGVSTFKRDGLACRTVAIANKAKGRSASGEYSFCQQTSGEWTLTK